MTDDTFLNQRTKLRAEITTLSRELLQKRRQMIQLEIENSDKLQLVKTKKTAHHKHWGVRSNGTAIFC